MGVPARQTLRGETARLSVERDLEVLSAAPKYYDWILDLLGPWTGRTVLECGAGSGHVTRRLLARAGLRVIATEVEEGYLPGLMEICNPAGGEAFHLDLEHLDLRTLDAIRSRSVDTILMVNVLEHVHDDHACVEALASSLTAGGRLLLMVPAHQILFSRMDRIYGHHRRYGKSDITALARATGLEVRFLRSMNLPGFFAWLVMHRILGRASLSLSATRVFNGLVPYIATVERLAPPPFGQSLLAVLERP